MEDDDAAAVALLVMRRAREATSPYSADVAEDNERGMRWQGQLNLDEEEEELAEGAILFMGL